MVSKLQPGYNNSSLDAERHWETANSWGGRADSALLDVMQRKQPFHRLSPEGWLRMDAFLITEWNFPWCLFARVSSSAAQEPSPSLPRNLSVVWLPPLLFSFCLSFLQRPLQNRDERFGVLALSLVIYFSLLWGRRLWEMWEQFTHQRFRVCV